MKTFFISVIAGSVFVGSLAAASPLTALAQTAPTIPNTTAYLNTSYETASTTYGGQSITFYANLSTTLPSVITLVDLELRNEAGKAVAQKSWNNVIILNTNAPTNTFSLRSPPNLDPGVYTWKVGLFTPGWKEQINWYDNPQSFAVVSTTTQSFSTTSTAILSGTWQKSSTMHEGNSNYLSAEFASTGFGDTVMVEMDLFDNTNALVAHKTWDYVTIPARQNVFEALRTPVLTAGTYHWGIGIFSPQRKQLLTWYDSPQSFTVDPIL